MADSAEAVLVARGGPARLRRAIIVTALLVAAAFAFGYIGWTQHVADVWLLALLCTAASPIAGMMLVVRLTRDGHGSRRLRLVGWFAAGAAIGVVLVPAAVILATSGAA
jgi:hypothetical protein